MSPVNGKRKGSAEDLSLALLPTERLHHQLDWLHQIEINPWEHPPECITNQDKVKFTRR